MTARSTQAPSESSTRFEALFRAYHPELVRFAARRLPPEFAPDVAAETLLTAWRRLPDIPVGAERAWLFATARNVIGTSYRQRARDQARHRAEAQRVRPSQPDHAGEVAERLRVASALAQLSDRDQEVLRLSEWDQLDEREAAAVLGCTGAAYRVRLHRARRRFAAALTGLDAGDRVVGKSVPEGELR